MMTTRLMGGNAANKANILADHYNDENLHYLRSFGEREFTYKDWDKMTYNSHGRYHYGLSLNTACDWGFVEVRQERVTRAALCYIASPKSELVLGRVEDIDRLPTVTRAVLQANYPTMIARYIPMETGLVRNYYRWNEEKFQAWKQANVEKTIAEMQYYVDRAKTELELRNKQMGGLLNLL